MTEKTKIFFPNLNGVRAIAAFMVMVSHIEIHKIDFINGLQGNTHLFGLGPCGVSVFFSLSGFLITYLLLEEKKNFSNVNFKDFYTRRILRIWPLYFLIIVAGVLIFPNSFTGKTLLLSIFFLPNIPFILKLLPTLIDPIWSVGVEEQFYIFHPHFFRIKKNQYILYALITFIVLFLIIYKLINQAHLQSIVITKFLYYARYNDMMIGAVFAVIYFNTKNKTFNFRLQPVFEFLFNKYVQIVLLVTFVAVIFLYLEGLFPQGDILIAILASCIIVNLCETGTSIYSLDHKSFQFTGRISYGIYLLHKFPLFAVLYLVNKYMATQPALMQNITIYIATFVLAIGLAAISYYGYERYFLLIKKRFQKVPNNVV